MTSVEKTSRPEPFDWKSMFLSVLFVSMFVIIPMFVLYLEHQCDHCGAKKHEEWRRSVSCDYELSLPYRTRLVRGTAGHCEGTP